MSKNRMYLKRETIHNGMKYHVPEHESKRDGKELYGKSYKTLFKITKEWEHLRNGMSCS
jgi:hypothetical protein